MLDTHGWVCNRVYHISRRKTIWRIPRIWAVAVGEPCGRRRLRIVPGVFDTQYGVIIEWLDEISFFQLHIWRTKYREDSSSAGKAELFLAVIYRNYCQFG
ncbi:hypothetical protein TWF225_010084 [Orbilia oligospora]|nr:hypothetical protein TWF225_010084 [Orbilia oligospora]KAF3247501.1 hypothetical protein TWF128_008581 [Orbilia oligospora]KAF3250865.1 hypothetical protein TWF217_008476 [Orbilia oligospora]KAF3277407.1 hypothetical protein TWF132_001651 [Orbilia oligospora]